MDANTLAKYIGKEHVEEVQTLMENDRQLLNKVSFKNPVVALVLSIFLGIIGIDRLYQGGVSVFACKLLLCLLTFGVWWIADLGYSVIMTKETNYKKIIAASCLVPRQFIFVFFVYDVNYADPALYIHLSENIINMCFNSTF